MAQEVYHKQRQWGNITCFDYLGNIVSKVTHDLFRGNISIFNAAMQKCGNNKINLLVMTIQGHICPYAMKDNRFGIVTRLLKNALQERQ